MERTRSRSASSTERNDNARQQQVRVSVADAYVPQIPEAKADDLFALFKFPALDKCEGEPTYKKAVAIRDQAIRNALAVKSPFGGGKHGHSGMIMPEATYLTEAGEKWRVPATSGVYPTFPATATTDAAKKRIIATFIETEAGIKKAEVMEELLRNQILDAFEEEFYMELHERVYGYDRVTPKQLLEHIFENYAKIDDALLLDNRRTFEEAPDMSRPIDVYFCKQERCQEIADDGNIPITDAEMTLMLQQHMGATGLVGSAYTKWRKKGAAERTWRNAKKYFREALKDVGDRSKIEAGETGWSANATPAKADMKATEELLDRYEEALDNIAMAATAKQNTLDTLIKTNEHLVKENTKLTAEVARLNNLLATQNTTVNKSKKTWPAWCDPDAYCWSCGYKVRVGHNSKTCKRKKEGHQEEATRTNTMGGSTANKGWGNAPNGN